MNIAIMVRGYIPAPRPKDMIYAPIDLAVRVAQGLSELGHNVDFYAPMGSSINGVRVRSANLRPLINDRSDFQELLTDTERMVHYYPAVLEAAMANTMFRRAAAGEYDVLHFHHPEVGLQGAYNNRRVPVVYTLHDPINEWYKEMFETLASPNQFFISISDNQRRDAPDLAYVRTVHNGVDSKEFKFDAKPDDYLLYCGRIVPEKGVREAIQVAKATHHRLLIIGPTYPEQQWYFDQHVKPQLNDQILYLGFIDQKQLPAYYKKAKALLTPVQWEEPFGMTTIEAMGCGTPVISFDRGAAPELIVHGRTGYIAKNTAEMIEAVGRIGEINRRDCRRHVQINFSIDRMVEGYELAFKAVLQHSRRLTPAYIKNQLLRVPKKLKESSQKRQLRKNIRANRPPTKLVPRTAEASENR